MGHWGVRYKYNHKHRGNQIIKSISKGFVPHKYVDQYLKNIFLLLILTSGKLKKFITLVAK